jgi:hypothetical protein
MPDYDKIVRERQKAIRRQIDKRGLAIKAIHLDGEWENSSTVLSYFPGREEVEPAVMSTAALYRLFKALPVDLLAMMLPEGFTIVRVPEGIDHDEIAEAVRDYLTAKDRAHHPDSPAGRDIADCEDDDLRAKFAVVVGGRAA